MVTRLDRRAQKTSLPEPEVSRRQALLALTLFAASEREDLWHPGYILHCLICGTSY